MSKLCSIIIRTKNEERWISSCLRSVFRQSYKNIEVIIVDNESTDHTVERSKSFPVKIISIDEFFPGKAINDGVRASSGDYIVCLSAHCIPVNEFWLEKLIKDIEDQKVAGIYGRQEPLSFSSDIDKRDLLTVFGLDKKIQVKDSFFHNANSAFRKDIWHKFPFDENISKDEVINAAKELGIHEFIMSLPENYKFNVQERGNTLSAGQKQLIAFMRVLIKNPDILILDEATSSIDSYSEDLIKNATKKITKNKTSIIIAHRLATIEAASTIIYMEDGVILEAGNHYELIELENGRYRKMHQEQFSNTEILD